MSDPEVRDEGPSENSPGGLFALYRCHRVDLRYRVATDKFDTTKFLAFFHNDLTNVTSNEAICRSLDPDRLDYHIHLNWENKKDEIVLYIGFFAGTIPAADREREPYAESFMPWLGGFFENHTAHGDIHVEFRYPLAQRRSVFFLPMKFTLSDDIETDIVGVSLRFPSRSGVVNGAKVQQSEKRLNVELQGSTRTDFSNFDLREEVAQLSDFALRMTEERKVIA